MSPRNDVWYHSAEGSLGEVEDIEGIALEQFRADAQALDDERFAAKHGRGFLVHASRERLQTPGGPQRTVAIDARETTDRTPGADFRVWPIRKSERSLIARFVSVGRTKRNDLVIPEVSLSKFHALFTEENGTLYVQDARSRNGTFVDGQRVNPQGEGQPTALRTGQRVKFGAAELTFLDATAFRRLVLEMSR